MLTKVSECKYLGVVIDNKVNWYIEEGQSPYFIMDIQEIKTTWHPVENIAGAGGGY